jgi:hypothetical protein
MTQIRRMPIPVIAPATGPISARTMSPSERPSRRVDRNSTVMSWTCTGKHRAGENPERARQIAHLRRKHRTDQWTSAGDRCEMMAVKHVLVGWNVIETVVMTNCRRLPRAVDPERPIGDEQPIKSIGD